MARRNAKNSNIRSLAKTGYEGRTYLLTIPKEIIEELGWREKQKVIVKRSGVKIVIEDFRK